MVFDREEYCEGVCVIGIVIEDFYGCNIVIFIFILLVRFNRNKWEILDKFIEYKVIIEKVLGVSL